MGWHGIKINQSTNHNIRIVLMTEVVAYFQPMSMGDVWNYVAIKIINASLAEMPMLYTEIPSDLLIHSQRTHKQKQ